jgi:type III secretion protein D
MAMFELRVLSGLHRGAALPLIGDEWVIGAADDTDLAMYDPGICDRHVRLSQMEGQWMLDRLDGTVIDARGDEIQQVENLQPNAPFAIAGVWLCLSPAEQPWPDEAALDEAAHISVPNGEVLEPTVVPARPSWPKRIAIAAAVITVASSALALTSQPDAPVVQQSPIQQFKRAKTTLPNPVEVRQELERMLQERELSAQVKVEYQGDGLVLVGEVPGQRLALVQRMIERFNDRYDTQVAVSTLVKEKQVRLPFQIVQIVGGKHGHVVTSTGQRLFLGDQIDGLRLTAIDNDRVSFDGEQRYEVTW